jgi:predicted hotdog family 3-hydroxylacyl-ACP dehydratase
MRGLAPPVPELTRHAPPMLLVDRILAVEDRRVRAEYTVAGDGLFFQPGRGLPAYVGLEIMAQTVSAWDGLRRRAAGREPQLGFLLGCRSYACTVDWFAAGEQLLIEAASLLDEGEMRSFDCRIEAATGRTLASAVMNVYRPDDPEAFLRGA